MRKLIFATQKLDSHDPILAATVAKVRALAERVDELVVICDSAEPGIEPANVQVREFRSRTQAQRGARFATALVQELRPRPIGVVAHMIPLYVVVAAPIVRPLRIPLLLWYTHWKAHPLVRVAERLATGVISVDRRSFPLSSSKLRPLGHGIDLSEFSCADTRSNDTGPLRAVALGRYSSTKGLETLVRGAALAGNVEVRFHGAVGGPADEEHKRALEALARELGVEAQVGGPLPRSEIPALLAESDVLVNNTPAGSADKVVFEAAASCLPVVASNPVFDDLLPPELRFERDSPESLAAVLRTLDRRRRPELRRQVVERHSVEHWADAVLATLAES
jgi:glycosyltransferase involved in cell wall biosynthesis